MHLGQILWISGRRLNGSLFRFNAIKLVESTLWNKVRPKLSMQSYSYVYRSMLSSRTVTAFSLLILNHTKSYHNSRAVMPPITGF